MQILQFTTQDTESVIHLWMQCDLTRAWNDPRRDIARKATVQPELFLTGCEDGKVIATIMAGYDGHRGWVNYLAVAPDYRDRGVGRALMAEVENRLLAIGCPKLNLMVRTSNRAVLAFYAHLGYVQDDAVCLGKRLIPDLPAAGGGA